MAVAPTGGVVEYCGKSLPEKGRWSFFHSRASNSCPGTPNYVSSTLVRGTLDTLHNAWPSQVATCCNVPARSSNQAFCTVTVHLNQCLLSCRMHLELKQERLLATNGETAVWPPGLALAVTETAAAVECKDDQGAATRVVRPILATDSQDNKTFGGSRCRSCIGPH